MLDSSSDSIEMKHVDEDWISLLEQTNAEEKELRNTRRLISSNFSPAAAAASVTAAYALAKSESLDFTNIDSKPEVGL
ncbi:hypothetical protein L1987_81832 [Smallanthus sonchifolius]|uniref:Uncharacterized protein n=1 Tax=Smallanthus sonchifolius TaxID=185202 RepID=A0ACB8YQT4_9ASTR|nr:hypothetical protein L1987_81832 [Smallanthus sonchifolius]